MIDLKMSEVEKNKRSISNDLHHFFEAFYFSLNLKKEKKNVSDNVTDNRN